MARRRNLNMADTLSPALLGRESKQLALVAAVSVAALAFAPHWLQIVAGVVDLIVTAASLAGLVVAWRMSRLLPALTVYAPAVVVFVVLALLNFRG